MSEPFRIKLKTSWESFALNTSFHGFAELHRAKSDFWKIFWWIICISACCLTAYQTYKAVDQYIGQPTNTVIIPANEDQIFYPPLQLCYWQWYYWTDLNKALKLYPKDALLASFSFFNKIYTADVYDVELAMKTLSAKMAEMNLSTLSEFYKSIARQVPIKEIANYVVQPFFDGIELVWKDPYLMYCYEISTESMHRYFRSHTLDKIITFKTIDKTYYDINGVLSPAEYNKYVFKWISQETMYEIDNDKQGDIDFTFYTPPISLVLFADSTKSLDMLQECDVYVVTVRASVYSWLNRVDKPCSDAYRSVPMNDTCQVTCQAKYTAMDCNCVFLEDAILVRKDFPDAVCYRKTEFLSTKLVDMEQFEQFSNKGKALTQNCSKIQRNIDDRDKCLSSCLTSCQIWKYEKTITTKTTDAALRNYGVKNYTQVYVEYPAGEDVIIMEETNAQSWEAFIGNVGGILGIWTGASIVSFVQLFYLCCCSDYLLFNCFSMQQSNADDWVQPYEKNDVNLSTFCTRPKERKNTTIPDKTKQET